MTRAQREIEDEIQWYEPKARTRRLMRSLGKLGFQFSGHGAGLGGEDFGLIYTLSKTSYLHAEISETPRGIKTWLVLCTEDTDKTLKGNLLRLARKHIKANKHGCGSGR